jgi:hypothetical protein
MATMTDIKIIRYKINLEKLSVAKKNQKHTRIARCALCLARKEGRLPVAGQCELCGLKVRRIGRKNCMRGGDDTNEIYVLEYHMPCNEKWKKLN